MPETNSSPKPKKTNQLSSFFLNSQNSSKVLLITVLMVFAGLGTWALFGARAANNSLSLVPASSSPSIGTNFTVTIRENSGTDAINAVQADLIYDQSKLQFVSLDTSTSAFDLSGPSTGGSGSVKISRAKSSTSLTGDQIVALVTFKALSSGVTSVTFANTSAIVLTSNASNVLSVTSQGIYTIADTTAPNSPTGLTAGTRTVNSIAFSWAASTDNVAVTGYKVYRNGTQINGNVGTNSFTDTNLTANTSYTYTVAAFDAANNTSTQSSGMAVATLPDTIAPSTPTGLTAGTRTVNSIAFSWAASTDNVAVTGYNIFRNGVKVGTSAISNYTDTGLTPGTNYSYTVSAYDGASNTSAASSTLATSTLADTTAPSAPTGLSSSNQTTNSITLNWAASTDNVAVTGYNIFRNGVKVGTSTTNTYTDSGLTQSTAYSYAISAYDSNSNTSASSAASSFTTKSKPGDVNSDGVVNILDLSVMATNWALPGRTFAQGDLNGDGTANILDLSILATRWGT